MVSKGPIAAGLALEAFANGSAPHLQDELSDAFSQLDPQYAKEVRYFRAQHSSYMMSPFRTHILEIHLDNHT